MSWVQLVGKGWSEEDRDQDRLVLQRFYNGSVYIMGKNGPMMLPVKDLVDKESEDVEFGWKNVAGA